MSEVNSETTIAEIIKRLERIEAMVLPYGPPPKRSLNQCQSADGDQSLIASIRNVEAPVHGLTT